MKLITTLFFTFNLLFLSSCSDASQKTVNANEETLNISQNENTDYQYNLGMDYLYGENGKERNDKKAMYWFKKAADLGDASAQNNLAILYAEGKGVSKNENEAERYFEMAAKQNHPNALVQTARRILEKNSIEKDNNKEEKAITLLEKAAEQQNNDAYIYLSKLYLDKDNSADRGKGILWLEKSANLGDSESMMKLYDYYKSNKKYEAEKWLKMAYLYKNKEAIKVFESRE